jgi:formate-dependent nitrite reductase membrane component NrfD
MNPDRNETEVTRDGLHGGHPERDALTGVAAGKPAEKTTKRGGRRRGGRRGGERPMVDRAEFTSYYGRPVLNPPTWKSTDIAGYLFLGGLAGASSVLGAGAQATGRARLSLVSKLGALGAITVSLVALIHDLGRPARFLNMLRVLKPTSPMSVGTWLLTGYGPLAGAAAASALTGRLPRVGAAATVGAAALGPAVAAYTAVLISDTAVPAWHDGHREMPYVFVGSAATAAAGLGLLGAPTSQAAPARALAVLGAAVELTAFELMQRRIGMISRAYSTGRAGRYVRTSQMLTMVGVTGAVLSRRSRWVSALSGAALLGASAATRFGIFHAGIASSTDPAYTVLPQRQRLDQRQN